MAYIVTENIGEQTTTAGAGPFALAGIISAIFATFGSEMAVGDTAPCIMWGVDANGDPTGEWQSGIFTYSAADTLTASTIYASSNAGATVNFSAGTKYIVIGQSAREQRFMPTTVLAADSANTTTTLANVSGLLFAAEANATYEVELMGVYQTAATTTGIAVALDIPSGSVFGLEFTSTSATAIGGTNQIADAATAGATTGVTTANTNTPILAKWIVKTGATAGNVQLMMRSEVSGSAATLKAGLCYLKARRIA